MILILRFYTHEAIPLSKIVIFTGSLSSFILNTRLKHPVRKARAIDYNLIIVIAPNLLFGTMLGVTLNKILPNVLIILFLTIVLFYNTYKTTKMGLKEYRQENERLIKKEESERSEENPPHNLTNNQISSGQSADNGSNNHEIEQHQKETLIEIQKDNKILRWDKLQFVIIPYIVMVALSLLRESSYVPPCSVIYWVIFTSFCLFAMLVNFITLGHIKKEYYYRMNIGFPYDGKDIIWTSGKCIQMGITGLTSGFIAGTIGIGGGVVLGPLLLGLGIYPVVSTVTTNFLVLLTSSSTSLQFILYNMMNYEYAIISIAFSVAGSYIGTKIIHYYFKQTGRESLLIFALVLVIGSSALILPISSILSTINDVHRGIDVFRFRSPCSY